MTQASPSRESCRALLRALPAFGAFKRAVYADAPPESRGWLGAMGVVARHPDGLRPSNVAEILHVDLSVASRALTQLEERGFVRREPDPDDGRATRVHATVEGSAWIADFAEQYAIRMQDYLADWSDDDVATLTGLLDRFGATLENRR
jgi:DNA-binding MarR family transcriptional regulator